MQAVERERYWLPIAIADLDFPKILEAASDLRLCPGD
jgi:hypothetical protein